MKIVQGDELPFKGTGLDNRVNGPTFRWLLLGEEGTPDNFFLMLSRQESFFSPRHHHNFDQFRYSFKGDIGLGDSPDGPIILKEGELCYFPEGAWYGPQNDGSDVKLVLVLQFGGVSGSGFISYERLKEVQNGMYERGEGEFRGGKFYLKPKSGGAPEIRDGFEALWEYANNKRLKYPEPLYKSPIIMSPERFAWEDIEGSENSHRKLLGLFSGGRVEAAVIWVSKGGRLSTPIKTCNQLFFVLEGKGQINGQALRSQTSIHQEAGDEAVFTTDESFTALHFTLPGFAKEH